MKNYHKQETEMLAKCARNIQHFLGNGFTRDIYMDALEWEFKHFSVPYSRNVQIPVFYGPDKEILPHKYTADFIIYDKIVVLVRSEEDVITQTTFTLLTMLHATKQNLAVLVQFKADRVQFNRVCRYSKFLNSVNIRSCGAGADNGTNEDFENGDFEEEIAI
ncbi:hypothetical protein FACS189494_12030 [Spirochaetia bacterium]|nr:hypothetical protein FACS189494_12030 [Spirochaetia bacterium]